MIFHCVRDRIQQNRLHIFWEEGKKKLADYVTKHHPIWNHRTMRPRYANSTKKDTENSKYQRNGTGRGCAGTNNPEGTWKPDNPLRGIRNTITRNPDNPFKVTRNLLPKGLRIQWPRELTVPTENMHKLV